VPDAGIEDAHPFDGEKDSGLQLVGFFGDRIRGQLKRHPEIEQNVHGTLSGLVGSGFSSQDINALESRAIDAASPADALALAGLQGGVPVTLSTRQWNTIDGLLRRMPQDDLGRRAYSAFKSGLANGKIRGR
jgi:hypothetical protein